MFCEFDTSIENPGETPVSGTVTVEYVAPGGETLTAFSFSGTQAPGNTTTKTISRRLPSSLPTGSYTVRATARDGDGNVLGMDEDVVEVVSDAPDALVSSAEVPTQAALTVASDVPVTVGPNPASGAARFSFGLAEAADVRLAVYDALGREVAVVAEGAMSAGAHAPMLQTSALPTGVYVWRLTAGARVESGRFTVVR